MTPTHIYKSFNTETKGMLVNYISKTQHEYGKSYTVQTIRKSLSSGLFENSPAVCAIVARFEALQTQSPAELYALCADPTHGVAVNFGYAETPPPQPTAPTRQHDSRPTVGALGAVVARVEADFWASIAKAEKMLFT